MQFWKNHPALRIVLMAVLFVVAMALVVGGWQMTGELAGLERPVARALERELGELGRHDALFAQNDRLHNKS